MLHSSVPESLSERIALDLEPGYLLVLISCHCCKLSLLKHECLHGPVVDRCGFVLSLGYHDVYPGLVAVHRVEYYL